MTRRGELLSGPNVNTQQAKIYKQSHRDSLFYLLPCLDTIFSNKVAGRADRKEYDASLSPLLAFTPYGGCPASTESLRSKLRRETLSHPK